MPGAFLWDDKIPSATLSIVAGAGVASMPLSNLVDPQPRLRARFVAGSAWSILIDFGAKLPIEALALISTSFGAETYLRWRASANSDMSSPDYDGGVELVETSAALGGNVVLIAATPFTSRYMRVDITDNSTATIDIGRLVAGPLWRPSRAYAYGAKEGREMLDRRDRNPLTGASFPVPALGNPRTTDFYLPLLSSAEVIGQHRAMVAAMGAVGDALWIPETTLAPAELNARSIWGAVASPGDRAMVSRDNFPGSSRAFSLTERI